MSWPAQTFAERLFSRLNRGGERFETRLLIIAVVSRAIGVHKLLLLNFYPFLQKYIQPHQRDVTDVLAALVQVRLLTATLATRWCISTLSTDMEGRVTSALRSQTPWRRTFYCLFPNSFPNNFQDCVPCRRRMSWSRRTRWHRS